MSTPGVVRAPTSRPPSVCRPHRGTGRASSRRPPQPSWSSPEPGLGQDRDDGGSGGLARRERPGRPGPGPRPYLHPQGRRRAVRADRPTAAWLRTAGLGPPAGRRHRRGGPRRHPDGVDIPRLCRTTRPASTPCGWGSSPSRACSARPRPGSVRPEVVARHDGPMDEVGWAESTVITAVVEIAGELAEHLVTPRRWRYLDQVLADLSAVPPGNRGPRTRCARSRGARQRGGHCSRWSRGLHLELKRSRDALDFADQMALAARLARDVPRVAVNGGCVSGPCCSTSSRTPRRPSWSAAVALRAWGWARGLGRARVRRGQCCVGDRGRRPAPVDLRMAGRERDDDRPLQRSSGRAASPRPGRRTGRRGGRGAAAADQLAQRPRDPRRREPRLGTAAADRPGCRCPTWSPARRVRRRCGWPGP